MRARTQNAASLDSKLGGLEPADLIRAFRVMYMARRLDDREILLKRQNRIFFQISGAGHEALQAAAGMALRAGEDWIFPYYRDRALCLALGMKPGDMLLAAAGAGADPSSGGRQMPSHWSCPELHIVSRSSATGTQFTEAVGCAHAGLLRDSASREITLVSTGEGATSEGEFWEAMNAASLGRLPVLFLIEDNGYAISVPVASQTAGGNVANLVKNFPGLLVLEVDGTDFTASYRTIGEAVAWCRAGKGPALVRGHCTRPYSHSLSDDERHYKSEAERNEEAARDPLGKFPAWLAAEGILEPSEIETIKAEVERELDRLVEEALIAPPAPLDSLLRHLYSETVNPASDSFLREPEFQGEPRTMVDEINLTLHEEMRRNPSMVVFGEDVADCSREEILAEVKGKGGVFKATAGLQREFGSERCFNTPIAEAAIAGRALGMAVRGIKPVAEIQFFDYIWPAMMQLRDEVAPLRWRSNGGYSCPFVLRVPIGGYLNGGGVYHSQSGEVAFTHIPGLRVVMPSNALDACGLLRTALRCDDPVLFLEHKRLYREPYNRSPHPGGEFTIPFGRARIVKTGENLTIVTYGALTHKSVLAAQQIEKENPGATVEVIDLRSLSPYDWDAIRASVEKTSRVLIAHEDCISWGFGAEIAARIASELFHRLDAPVGRVGAQDVWVAYHPQAEAAILPQVEDVVREARRVLAY
jgi:2-oxoisovalerate dehydrogenase E1 component